MDVDPNSEIAGEHQNTLTSSEGPLDDFETICSGLEKVDLTEEEADALLSEALELNKRLKEELRRQEERETGLLRGGARTRPLGLEGVTDRKGNVLVPSLPPINPVRGLPANQQGVFSSLETRGCSKPKSSKVASIMQRKTHSADGGKAQHASPSGHPKARSTQSAEFKQRPEWNDRFSF